MKKLFSLLFTWKVPIATEDELAYADVVLTHEFGDQELVSRSTAQIADVGVVVAKQFKLPMICQWPGNKVTHDRGITPILVIKEHELKKGGYLDTNEVNRQAAAYCKREGWKYIVLCTHPDHAWRAGENLKHYGMIPLFPDLRRIEYAPFCKRTLMTKRWRFVSREFFVRLGYYLFGYLGT